MLICGQSSSGMCNSLDYIVEVYLKEEIQRKIKEYYETISKESRRI